MNARPLVLLTDYGATDFYAGVTRAVIAASSPASRVIDLQHDLPAHDIATASFVLARAFEYLPPDAVIVVVVDPGVGTARDGLVVLLGGRVLVGPDNGFASDLLAVSHDAGSAGFFAIDDQAAARMIGARSRGATFHGRDIFAPVAAAIARGADPASLSSPRDGIILLRDVPSVSIDGGRIHGAGRYVDRFGNVLTDIPQAAIQRVFQDEQQVEARASGRNLGALRSTYAQGSPGAPMALINSWGLVEVAVNGGRAIDYFEGAAPRSIHVELRARP